MNDFKVFLKSLTISPGVYQFYNNKKEIIYVGKAKNLKKRVSSYFNKNHTNNKTRILVKNIFKIEYIVVNSEMDALLLENSLIKKYKPRYNVLLKDDKTFPWICLKKNPFPKVFPTRKVIKDGSIYFGPYPNVKTVYTLLDLIKEIYPFLNHELNHLMKINDYSKLKQIYEENKISIKNLINGNFKPSIEKLNNLMKSHSMKMEFEEAQKIKEKLDSLKNYQSKSTVVSSKITNVDVFSIITDENYGYINFFQVAFGSIIRSRTIEIKKRLDETDKELLLLGIVELRQLFNSNSKEIYIPFKIDLDLNIKVTVPKSGDKKNLLNLSERNAKYFRMEKFKQIQIIDPERHTSRIMNQIKTDLKLVQEPRLIECFDNSNLQGSNPVAACVVFKNGKPNKKDYRHYNIKNVKGPDDFASMEEVVFRRYKRLVDENCELPQLIIIDGGKGQISSTMKSLEKLKLENKISVIGIAKRLEEIFFPGDPTPIYLDKRSETLKIIQHLRNEAHRFSLAFHKNKRSKKALNSKLDNIKGIGPKNKILLLNHFRSFKRIKAASLIEISTVLGPKRGNKLFDTLKNID